MEPDVMVVHPSQPSLNVRDDLPSEEEFGDFGGFSDRLSLESSPSSFISQHPPAETPASHQPNCSSRLSQHSRLASSTSCFSEEQRSEPAAVLSNGFSSAAALEETGFADFTVLTEEASQSWCCGFSPVGEQWSNETRKAHSLNEPPQEVVVAPKSSCVLVKDSGTEVQHCVRAELSQKQSQAVVAGLGWAWDMREREVADGGRESPADSSFCDDISFEGHSDDLEHNVSSLACTSQEDQTDAEDEEERSISSLEGGTDFCLVDNQAAQETSATSTQEKPVASRVPPAEVRCLSSLPPSDSFADFCSAPVRDDEDGRWEEFEEHETVKENGTGHFVLQKEDQEESKTQVSDWVHNSFPEEDGKEAEEEKVPSLGALLHLSGFEEEKEEMPALPQRVQRGCWWPHQDLHTAVGLQFQWAGSHTNRSLLRCLGVDTKNIVFIGVKKQPVCVPAFASSLGMLEPTKDSENCSSGSTVASELRHSSNSEQDPLSSSLLVRSGRGLSCSQDGCCTLNLDYFGAEEVSGSSRGSNTPPPGVDPELYDLTICRLEASMKSLENTLSDLMATSENTSIRWPDPEEELSPEASRTLSGLPSLSFMKATFLMFPCSLAEEHSNI